MSVTLPAPAVRLLDAATHAVLTTLNPDGGPQSSVIWVTRDGDTPVFSTILGRRKTRNIQRDPRVSLLLMDPASFDYVEIRGTVSLTEAGGDELIRALCAKYTDGEWTEPRAGSVRVVCRVTPAKVVSYSD